MYVALDIGLRYVGMATSSSHIIATPHKVLRIKHDLLEEIVDEINIVLEGKHLEKLFIGNPLHMDGNESEMSKYCRTISTKLQRIYPKTDIILVDERLTSKSTKTKKSLNFRNDAEVAATILHYQINKLIDN